jgi:hypothetical protein
MEITGAGVVSLLGYRITTSPPFGELAVIPGGNLAKLK